MIIYSLSGPSGTGKSTSALQFAHEQNIQAIIDDGLFIVNGEKVAGTSAKFEKNTLKAVRRAIFDDDVHKEEILKAIQSYEVKSILIIGTSDKMTKKIAARLEIGEINHFYYVQDIRTEKEIRIAKYIREVQGKHVMPVPYKQVEQNFFKRLVQRGKEIFSSTQVKLGETTIVQPDFHQNSVYIARSVYLDVLEHVLEQQNQITKFEVPNLQIEGVPQMNINIYLRLPVHYHVPTYLYEVQKDIADVFSHQFGIEPEKINLQLRGIK
ncbi:ATP-binding protein [Solibacillus merdavium]|uniref:ATP-binding protein n=1 Tax=Solibacillus merdavium TaxID=2762218 RepID=A0ABR8XLH4_9BACL|nr:ATP-binding protein [Solibacillus merdavium]MBD8032789.1 ATP-binding protein [Solibacillus merdavium]